MKGSPVLVRLGLLLPVLSLYVCACLQPALFMDSGGHQHGDTAGPGRGTLTGLTCLLFGWLPDKLTVSWYANPALLTAMVLFALGRHNGASLFAILASALGLATPLLLPHESSHPLAYPLAGYYWWQSSLILMQAIAGVFGAKTPGVRVSKGVLIGAAIAMVSLQPAVFREREARTVFRIKGRLVLPPGEDPKEVRFELTIPDAHLDVYPPPLRFTRWNKDMKIAADGRFEVDSRLPVVGEPTVVEMLVESPSLLPFKASHPLTRTGNVYHTDLPDSVISPLALKPLEGPATFEHPSMDFMIYVPQGWKCLQALMSNCNVH